MLKPGTTKIYIYILFQEKLRVSNVQNYMKTVFSRMWRTVINSSVLDHEVNWLLR